MGETDRVCVEESTEKKIATTHSLRINYLNRYIPPGSWLINYS